MGKHAEWRKEAKKARRKRVRQHLAKIRDDEEERAQKLREKSPTYQIFLEQQREAEEFQVQEEARKLAEQNERWLKIEKEAQKQWQELQKKLELARAERLKQNAKIRDEWEREQARLKKLREEKELELEQKRLEQEKLLKEVDDFIENGGSTPEHLKTLYESNPNKEICPFFKKTSTCRFGNTCSRNHIRPGVSKLLLLSNFYNHISLQQTENEHGSDTTLEFENYETYNDYKDFFFFFLPEMETCGKVVEFRVCCNHSPHLRGNVYVEYSQTREALRSYRKFNGRFYGGKQLRVEFINIESWKSALCGLYFKQRCPKGTACNFLHVFRNPYNLFSHYVDYKSDRKSDSKNWKWSDSSDSDEDSYRTFEQKQRNGSPRSKRSSKFRKSSSSRSFYKERSLINKRHSGYPKNASFTRKRKKSDSEKPCYSDVKRKRKSRRHDSNNCFDSSDSEHSPYQRRYKSHSSKDRSGSRCKD